MDKELLEAVSKMMDEKLEPIRFEIAKTNMTIENEIHLQLQTLAEGQKTILQTLAPKSRGEALEDEVSFLKLMIKTLSKEVSELKKAE